MTIKYQLFFEYSFNQHMKKQILRGEGIQGMCLTLSVYDMFAANETANELKNVIDNHKECKEYNNTPFDKRKELFPEGAPSRIELSEMTLNNLHKLMCKLALDCKSTMFDDNENENTDRLTDEDAEYIASARKCLKALAEEAMLDEPTLC